MKWIFGLQILFFSLLVLLYVAAWVHLDGSQWGYVLLIAIFAERVLRVVKIHFKKNGRTWYDL